MKAFLEMFISGCHYCFIMSWPYQFRNAMSMKWLWWNV